MSDAVSTFWDNLDGDEPAPPVTPDRVAAWEAARGVRLPATLVAMFREQDGGTVANTEGALGIEPLGQISSLDGEAWEHLFRDDNDRDEDGNRIYAVGDPARVFHVGNLDSSLILLDYNDGDDDPRLLWVDEDEIHPGDEPNVTFDELIRLMIDGDCDGDD